MLTMDQVYKARERCWQHLLHATLQALQAVRTFFGIQSHDTGEKLKERNKTEDISEPTLYSIEKPFATA